MEEVIREMLPMSFVKDLHAREFSKLYFHIRIKSFKETLLKLVEEGARTKY